MSAMTSLTTLRMYANYLGGDVPPLATSLTDCELQLQDEVSLDANVLGIRFLTIFLSRARTHSPATV